MPVTLNRVALWALLAVLASGCTGPEEDERASDAQAEFVEDSTVACDPTDVGEEEGEVTTIYSVLDGELDALCYGVSDPVVEASWDSLATVANSEALADVLLFAGYEAAADTMAFAGPIDDDNQQFVIAVDIVSAADDADELRLTMVHELAHVLTQTPDQLDTDLLPEECETLWNGLGCFRSDSYVAGWVEQFWTDEDVASLPGDGAIDEAGGEDRCVLEPNFVGSYAASHPEEDFAETFSAWVFSVDVDAELAPKFDYFATFPELVVMRQAAIQAGLVDLPSNFDRCG